MTTILTGESTYFSNAKLDCFFVEQPDGSFLKNKHVTAQLKTLKDLGAKGYYACFVCDLDEGMSTVAGYMKLKGKIL